jgi:GTP-binding protein HflX
MTSALTGAGVSEFLDALSLILTPDKVTSKIKLAFSEGRERAWLFEQGVVVSEQQTVDGFVVQVRWTLRQKKGFNDQHF